MDIISFNEASTANGRIESFIENPDSTSGVLTVPKTIAAGETITIPAGRVAILPDLQVDGDLVIDGDLFIPTGSMTSQVVQKVTSTDNAVVRFDGVTGQVQNSTIIIDDNNNVGIGVISSPWSIGNALDIGHGVGILGYSNCSWYTSNTYYESVVGWKYKESAYASMYEQSDGLHKWLTAPSGTAGSTITWTNAMTLDASGNLLLGLSGGTGVIQAAHAIYSWNNASNHTYINNQTVSGAAQVFVATVGGALKAAILANGTYQSATNVYGSTSDAKLKENIADASPKLEKLMQVQVRNFNFIGQEDKQIGVIAQEIEQVFPSLIFETKDTKQVEVTKTRDVTDEEGNVTQEEYTETETVETGEVTKNVKYSIIYMMMLKGLQEMRAEYTAEINDLKARIEILEGAK